MIATQLRGISGTLLPSAFVSQLAAVDARTPVDSHPLERVRQDVERWWRGIETRCGPATGLHAVVDDAALPLFRTLGYQVMDVARERDRALLVMRPASGAPVAAIVRPWAARRSESWREVARAAARAGAAWVFVWAPPFLSLVDASPSSSRRALEMTFPAALDRESFARVWTLCSASSISRLRLVVLESHRFQDAVRTDLQRGVMTALRALERAVPRGRAAAPGATPFDQALTLVYRLLFLMFAEARDLVPVRHPAYGRSYAIRALCRDALEERAPVGLWEGLAAITRMSRAGCRADDLIVRPFNGRLFARGSAPALERRRRLNRGDRGGAVEDAAMQEALIAIATRPSDAGRVEINYADLGVEQLGAVYERVLDIDAAPRRERSHSARRKESGTFYTPQPLAEFLVRRTLAPLVSGATSDAILALRVVDPSMGSGACLVAACRYLARAYRHALVDEGRCADADFDADERARIRRLIAERCLAGVDANPVAAQLARLSLWLTTLSRGRPLSFLDHRLRVGNSLIGASPEDLTRLGTNPRRTASLPLFEASGLDLAMQTIAQPLFELTTRADDTVRDVHVKESLWAQLTSAASPLEPWRRACDLWCARWFWRTGRPPSPQELREALDAIFGRGGSLNAAVVRAWIDRARDTAKAQDFFHWPLEFADVFYDERGQPRPRPGFDAVIGNPPWEMLRRDPRAEAGDARDGAHLVTFIRESGLFPSCDRGHMNLYQPFLERALSLARPGGQVGLVLPWGVCTDDGAAGLRRRLFERSRVSTIVGLDNSRGLFPIHRGLRFAVIVASPGGSTNETRMRLGVRTAEEIAALPDTDRALDSAYPVRLSPADLARMSGPALRVPDVRRAIDHDLLSRLTRDFPAAGDGTGWALSFGRELNASDDRDAFGRAGLPIVDGKHVSPFVVDAHDVQRRIDPGEARRRLPDRRFEHPRLGYRDVSGVGNRLALIAAIVPGGMVTTHTVFCLRTRLTIEQQHFLCACFNSYVLNTLVRALMGGHVTTSLVERLPLPVWRGDAADRRIARLAARLAVRPASARAQARVQQAVARRYGVARDAFAQILDGFPLVDESDRRLALEDFAL